MTILEEQLGLSMTVQEVADYMKIDSSTVRKYYRELGGVRFGKVYRFFERRLNDAIQAQGEMACPGEVKRPDQTQDISNQKRSNRMGGRTKATIQKIDEARDKFCLLT
jgi:excisionase family DNA binding protein